MKKRKLMKYYLPVVIFIFFYYSGYCSSSGAFNTSDDHPDPPTDRTPPNKIPPPLPEEDRNWDRSDEEKEDLRKEIARNRREKFGSDKLFGKFLPVPEGLTIIRGNVSPPDEEMEQDLNKRRAEALDNNLDFVPNQYRVLLNPDYFKYYIYEPEIDRVGQGVTENGETLSFIAQQLAKQYNAVIYRITGGPTLSFTIKISDKDLQSLAKDPIVKSISKSKVSAKLTSDQSYPGYGLEELEGYGLEF